MNTTLSAHDGYVLAKLEGVLDEGAKADFDEHLHPIIGTGGNRLLVDLSQASRITSAGIGHLVTLASRANTKGSQVILVNPSPFVASIFEATKLTKFFDIESSIENGVARVRERP